MKEEKALNLPDPPEKWSGPIFDILKRTLFSGKDDIVSEDIPDEVISQDDIKETFSYPPETENLTDDYLKLLYNSVVGGVGYDLPKFLYETNPVEFMGINQGVGKGLDYLGYESAGDWVGGDWPGIGDWAFGGSPFDEDLKEKMRFDYDPGAVAEHPYIFGGPDEGLEEWTRLAAQIGIPLAGWMKYPAAAKKAYSGLGNVFPSLKYWDDLGIMNQKIRSALNRAAGTKSNWPKITGVWDKFLRPIYQMPTRMAKHAINPLRWRGKHDKNVYDKLKKLFEIDKIKSIKNISKISKPERTYAGTAGRNWAIGTGVQLGLDTVRAAKADEIDIDVPKGIETIAPSNRAMIEMANRRGGPQEGWGMSVEFPNTGQRTARYELPD